jgi:diguanylate cyclase (GGDEF)-like protein/PAS domain S-box-containing protein
MPKLSAPQWLVVGLVVFFVIMLVTSLSGYRATAEFTTKLESYKPSYAVLEAVGRVRSLDGVIELAGRNAVASRDENTMKQYKTAVEQVRKEIEDLKRETAESPVQQERVTTLTVLIQEQIDAINRAMTTSKRGKHTTAQQPSMQKQKTAPPQPAQNQEQAAQTQPSPQKQEAAPQQYPQNQEPAAQALPQKQEAAPSQLPQKQEPAAQPSPPQQEAAPQQLPAKPEPAAQPPLQKQETAPQPATLTVDIPVSGGIKTILDRMEEDEKTAIKAQRDIVRDAARRPMRAMLVAGIAAIAMSVFAYLFILIETDRRQRTELRLKDCEAKFWESEKRFGLLSEDAKEYAFAVLDDAGRVMTWNGAAERMLGYSADEIKGKFFSRFYPEDDAKRQPTLRTEKAALQGRFEEEGIRVRRDGTVFPARETLHVLRDDKGKLNGYAVVLQDLTDQQRSQETIKKLGLSVELASDLVAITRLDGAIEYVNHAVEEVTGYAKDELIGKTLAVLRSPEPHIAERNGGAQPGNGDSDPDRVVTVNRKKNGELFYLSEVSSQITNGGDKPTHLIVTARDVTRQRSLEDRLRFLSRYDALTGLSNRDDFMDRLRAAIERSKEGKTKLAVLVVVIDRFKYINDVFGGDAGNTVLKLVGERVREVVGDKGATARFGSDEFGVLLENIAQPADVVSVVGSIIENASRGISVDGRNVFVTLSVGAALCPSDGDDAGTLAKNADIALAQAKAGGINSIRFYSAEVNARMSELVEMEQRLFGALQNNEYEVNYQPYCDMDGKKMVGAEALIRWINRDLGVVSPARFIRTLESTGMIIDVGAWVLKTVCGQIKKMDNGTHEFPVSVNLSAAQFRHDRLIEMVRDTIKAIAIDPRRIVMEVTESVFMEDILFAQAVLKELKNIGVAISIDDFGTGYSSLTYLKKLPVDVLKIDQSFVKDVTHDPDTASIITSITTMARNLGIKTIAEGVETEEQWKVLRLLRCDMGQGYYFSRALNIDDFERYMK